MLPTDDLIARWQDLLPGFDATQHLTKAGPAVEINLTDESSSRWFLDSSVNSVFRRFSLAVTTSADSRLSRVSPWRRRHHCSRQGHGFRRPVLIAAMTVEPGGAGRRTSGVGQDP
jgi:hypothetical protein